MRSGELRHVVEIHESTQVRDTAGARVDVWRKRITARMAGAPIRASERNNGNQTVAETDWKFICRYRNWVTPKHRLVFDNATWDIAEVNDIGGRQRTLEIVAKRAA